MAGAQGLSKIPAKSQISIALEDLVINNRQETYAKLLSFLSITDSHAMQNFFINEMTPDAATSGRWKTEIDSFELSAGYDAMVRRLNANHISFK